MSSVPPPGQEIIPIQPVDEPILCSPYEEPAEHWVYDTQTGAASRIPGRREASYWFRYQSPHKSSQMGLFVEEERELLPVVNALREDVKRWRKGGYQGATKVTRELLAYWSRQDRPRRLFFCQLEAAETVIYLNEIRLSGRRPQFTPHFTDDLIHNLWDQPADPDVPALRRLGCKMATGSGKTVVMALLLAWSFCNRGQVPSDERFPRAAVVVCPNLTIKERLQVLRPENPDNYYAAFDLVPTRLRPLLQSGKVLVENWHAFLPLSEHHEGGKSWAVVDKGPEGPDAFARRVLGDLHGMGKLLVFNDEAHHAWRPPALLTVDDAESQADPEVQEATVWVNGLDKLNQAVGIHACIDMSATPFYIAGSGYTEGSPFPWLVSDFGLVDAIESGIVKIPRLPAADSAGHPEAKYYRLWQHVVQSLKPGEKLTGGRPKPEAAYLHAEDALLTLAGQWKERFEQIRDASPGQDRTPPVMIVVCDNTAIAEVFYRNISGEREEEVVEIVGGKERTVKRTSYGHGRVLPDYLANRESFKPTLRIDSKLLAEAESGDQGSRQEAAQQLRRIVSTVGKPGEPGEHVRCVVSVAMLTEGWDANNVTHILGLRAFGSQLLCEQVVGRGLRRMDYIPDPKTGRLREEYVDIYGVPFSLIPFRGRQPNGEGPADPPPLNHVRALPERAAYEMRFPVVERYVVALQRNVITADIEKIEPLEIDPALTPTSVFVVPHVGYTHKGPGIHTPFEVVQQDREAYYASTHIQQIEFQLAQQIVEHLTEGSGNGAARANESAAVLRLQSRHRLFPQVLRLVHAYIERKVRFHGVNPCELGLAVYFGQVVDRLLTAIRPDESQGEAPLLPVLNRYEPIGSTERVNFKTTRPTTPTHYSHVDHVAADTNSWEQAAAFQLEKAAMERKVRFYVRNEGLEFTVPYEFLGYPRAYVPDFLVRLVNDVTLILEVKGWAKAEDHAKHEAARRWCDAVNNWGKLGRWAFHVCRNPHELGGELAYLLQQTSSIGS